MMVRYLSALVVSLLAISSFADSEMTGPKKVLRLRALDTKKKIVTEYKIEPSMIDDSFSPANLSKMDQKDADAKVKALIAKIAVPANLISSEKIEVVKKPVSKSEVSGSTPAYFYAYRGVSTGFGYGGCGAFYGGGCGYGGCVAYRPYWGYCGGYYAGGCCGYRPPCYPPYYGGCGGCYAGGCYGGGCYAGGCGGVAYGGYAYGGAVAFGGGVQYSVYGAGYGW